MLGRAAAVGLCLTTLLCSSPARAEPGALSPVAVDQNGNNYGYWEFLPPAYTDDGNPWPLIVYLSGVTSVGTGIDDSPCGWPLPPGDASGDAGLCNNVHTGVQAVIYQSFAEMLPSMWPVDERPFVVVSPQNPIPDAPFDVAELEVFFEYLQRTYNLDTQRLYLLGNSEGGRSVLLYLHHDPARFAAAAVMPGGDVAVDPCGITNHGLWAFHGENDPVETFELTVMSAFMADFDACPAPGADGRFTVYLDAQHDVWTRTYRPQLGLDDPVDPNHEPYEPDLYTWLLLWDRPLVDAGPDVEVDVTQGEVGLQGVVTDQDVVTWSWTQLAGTPLPIRGADTDQPVVSGLMPGTHTFVARVVDADGLWAEDELVVTVTDATATTGSTTTDATGSSGTTASSDAGTSPPPTSDSSANDDAGSTDPDGATSGSAADPAEEEGNGCGCATHDGPRGDAACLLLLIGLGLPRAGLKRTRRGPWPAPPADAP